MTLAVGQNGDAVGDGKDDVHIVLDEKDAVAAAKALEERDHGSRFLRPHAGSRLVHQQQLGAARERHRDLEQAMLAMREVFRARRLPPAQADLIERGERPLVERRFAVGGAPETEARARHAPAPRARHSRARKSCRGRR